MKVIYPVIITKDDEEIPYLVEIPALNGMTQGTSLTNAFDMARDYIGIVVVDLQDRDQPIPDSMFELPEIDENQIATLIDVDIDKYRKLNDTRPVKKTLTIPSYLNDLGIKEKVNFSEILADGLRKRLDVR
ncbi:type II toxin-antitoxin system HicB family antitoxin [Lactobacillus sp. YT155]|uniref:type II toxin-antitoxin system HicB family antitoxin n=1 Tax=Lactobacillus sp. YT155 TaxID=3060955 RepID=UPI00265E3DB8|nr:type II toxin-antitoxin system HicB family antitoxin [Lactobacillus sp. YT155]MDO1604719.1 type II toxin-antitoxin system HicB family antitoxin [Lactobacillus sp. YT155]